MPEKPSFPPHPTVNALLGDEAWSGTRNYSTSLYEHIYALGVVAANYNKLESGLALLIAVLMGGAKYPASSFLFQKLSNNERLDFLKRLYTAEIKDPDLLDRLDWLVVGYAKCADNRNILMHSELERTNALDLASTLELKKASKSGSHNFISLGLKDLRQVADDIDRFENFVFDLVIFESARRNGGKLFLPTREIAPSLPDRPPEPLQLKLSDQRPAKGGKSEPQSSGG
jgi:hypothetical protein